jgi:hypothetical protein
LSTADICLDTVANGIAVRVNQFSDIRRNQSLEKRSENSSDGGPPFDAQLRAKTAVQARRICGEKWGTDSACGEAFQCFIFLSNSTASEGEIASVGDS